MSIKLTTFDVTIGRLKVTFGMWNLSKIFLTIKCASSVRNNTNLTQVTTYYCLSFLYIWMETLFWLYHHVVIFIAFPRIIHNGWYDHYVLNGHLFELSHWRRVVNSITNLTQATTYYCLSFLYKWMQSLFWLYHHVVVLITFPKIIYDGW